MHPPQTLNITWQNVAAAHTANDHPVSGTQCPPQPWGAAPCNQQTHKHACCPTSPLVNAQPHMYTHSTPHIHTLNNPNGPCFKTKTEAADPDMRSFVMAKCTVLAPRALAQPTTAHRRRHARTADWDSQHISTLRHTQRCLRAGRCGANSPNFQTSRSSCLIVPTHLSTPEA